jgi:hypothetical protein
MSESLTPESSVKGSWGHPFDYNFIPFKIDYDGERLIFENGMSIIF